MGKKFVNFHLPVLRTAFPIGRTESGIAAIVAMMHLESWPQYLYLIEQVPKQPTDCRTCLFYLEKFTFLLIR